MKSVEFKYAGILFNVDLDEDEEHRCVDTVFKVSIWNELNREYEVISCNTDEFKTGMEDAINDALYEMYENARLAHEDMMFDAMRDEMVEKGTWGK